MLRYLLYCLVLVVGSTPYLPAVEYAAKITKTKDGDTFVCDIELGLGVILTNQTVRMSDYDAWESRRFRQNQHIGKITTEELEKGRLAHKALDAAIAKAKTITVEPQKPAKDSFGRWLFILRLDGERASVQLIKDGHQRPAVPRALWIDDDAE